MVFVPLVGYPFFPFPFSLGPPTGAFPIPSCSLSLVPGASHSGLSHSHLVPVPCPIMQLVVPLVPWDIPSQWDIPSYVTWCLGSFLAYIFLHCLKRLVTSDSPVILQYQGDFTLLDLVIFPDIPRHSNKFQTQNLFQNKFWTS